MNPYNVAASIHISDLMFSGPDVLKKFFVLNSAELEILNAYMYKKYQETQLSPGSDKPRIKISCFVELSMKKVL